MSTETVVALGVQAIILVGMLAYFSHEIRRILTAVEGKACGCRATATYQPPTVATEEVGAALEPRQQKAGETANGVDLLYEYLNGGRNVSVTDAQAWMTEREAAGDIVTEEEKREAFDLAANEC